MEEPINTREALFKALQNIKSEEMAYTPEKYRYVIYARKSTDENDKQARSLPDQISECKKYAEAHDLKVVEIIQEAESAKQSDTRPKFKEMLENIAKKGTYNAILAWHPDRLARNMKDAGTIIDLIDKNIIKDLKFVSFMFENTASGKMFLGITFAISKQYSDKLSDDVSRGNRLSIADGKYINKAKHGYYKDADQRLQPDGDNFILIKRAFQLRLEGKTYAQIAEFLNQNNYDRSNTLNSKKYTKMTTQKVEKFMRDSVYTGILSYGKSTVDLIELYNFEPMITVEEFLTINKLSPNSKLFTLSRTRRKGDSVQADLMRGMIICGKCNERMSAGQTSKITKKGKIKYFYYRCDNSDCSQKGKSVRARVILSYITGFLNKKPFSSQVSYDHYVAEMKNVSQQRIKDTRFVTISLRAKKQKLNDRFSLIKEILPTETDTRIQANYKKEYKELEDAIFSIDKEIEEKEEFLKKQSPTVLTYNEFIELLGNIPMIMPQITNQRELDYIVRKMFLNFTIKNKKVVKSTLAYPFNRLTNVKLLKGAGWENRTPNLSLEN